MATSGHPLAALLGPLRYACARDFSNLGSVKQLGTAISGALDRAGDAVKPATLAALRAQLPWVDDRDPAVRKNALQHVLVALRDDGLPIDFLPQTPPRPELVLSELESAPSPPPRATVPRPPRKPTVTKKKNPPPEPKDEDGPARMLSIAPASGPLATPLNQLGWRLSPRLVGLLNKKGVRKVGDVLFLLPRVYEDRRQLKQIAQLRSGERGTIVATVRRAEEQRGRGGRGTFRAVLSDATGSIAATHYQTGPWLKAKYPIGKRLVVSGEVRQTSWGWEIPHPEIEPADDIDSSPIHFNRVVPVYPGFERHEQRALRELAFKVADKFAGTLEEPLPEALQQRHGLMTLADALRYLHFPPADAPLDALDAHRSPAHRRLAFDELFFLQLGLALRRQGVKVQPGIAFDTSPRRQEIALKLLPFQLTGAQARVVGQLGRDLARAEPMNRLLQGDVGSGKTAVAVVAAALALQDGYQVAVMAPTEILAEQHHRTFAKMLAPLGKTVSLMTGSALPKARRAQREALATGKVSVAIGTHALIQEGVEFQKLGLVVIDEQHRFGVLQRHLLMAKGPRPDTLVMTATPIPRTLAMTLYGDLDVSVIDELPPGRTPIETRVYVEKARPRAYRRCRPSSTRAARRTSSTRWSKSRRRSTSPTRRRAPKSSRFTFPARASACCMGG